MLDASSPRLAALDLDLPAFRPRAIVFDLDGTLTDNMALHAEAFAAFSERHGLAPQTLADRRRLDGKRNSEIFPVLFGREIGREELLVLEQEKESLYREWSVGRLSPAPGALALIERARAHGIAVAVATSAPAENVTHTLREIGLPGLSDVVARGDMVPRGKPFPDVFLEAARRVGVDPSACLAFEDAPMGVEAAVMAGMVCVALTTSFDAATLRSSRVPPHACVAHYDEFLDGPGAWLRA
jgi:HAD superfamily hydrolase (TIGR01509 family)